MKLWKVLIPVFVVALFVAWYEFRPEQLVVNKRVHEELPAAQGVHSPRPSHPEHFIRFCTLLAVPQPSTVLGTVLALFASQ